MSGRAATSEKCILELFKNQNRPFSVQVVADFVAQHGIKKAQVQKTLDSLAEKEKITVKEFGKTKIFWPVQSTEDILSKEEVEKKKKELKDLKAFVQGEADEVGQLQKEHSRQTSTPTLEEMETEIGNLTIRKEEIMQKLTDLRENTVLISSEERGKVEKSLQDHIQSWRKWKGAFREIWGALSESTDRKKTELFEEIGVETDEDVGCSLEEMSRHLPGKRRRLK